MATTAERDAVTKGNFTKSTAALPGGTSNVMPGQANVGAKDAPFGYQKSYIWEAALNAGRTVRSYGFQMVSNIGAIKDASGNPTPSGPAWCRSSRRTRAWRPRAGRTCTTAGKT
jgi:hypothetical protein